MRTRLPLVVVTALALTALSCSTISNLFGMAQRFGGVDVEDLSDIDPEEIEAQLEELEQSGELEELGQLLDEGLELMADFPADFPMPAGMSVEASYELDNTINGVIQYSGTAAEAEAEFEASLTEAGWSIDSQSVLSTPLGDTIMLEISGPSGSGTITIVDFSDEGAAIEISLEQ